MAISKSKRRYSVSLTPANVDRFKALCEKIGLPHNTMSNACDDVIRDLCGVFEEALQSGKFGLDDLFRLMGKQMELVLKAEEEEKRAYKQKRNKAT